MTLAELLTLGLELVLLLVCWLLFILPGHGLIRIRRLA